MTERGATYIPVPKTTQKIPTTSERFSCVRTMETSNTKMAATKTSSATNIPRTFILFFPVEKMMKRQTYVNSMTRPEPFMVRTSVLCGCTRGKPYTTHNMQLTRVAKYGTAENSSTDFFFIILTNVGLKERKYQTQVNRSLID